MVESSEWRQTPAVGDTVARTSPQADATQEGVVLQLLPPNNINHREARARVKWNYTARPRLKGDATVSTVQLRNLRVVQRGGEQWPEHEKLQLIANMSQPLGEFLDWMGSAGYVIARWNDNIYNPELRQVHIDIQKLLAEFFHVDLKAIHEEKDRMYAQLVEANRRKEPQQEVEGDPGIHS